MPRNSPNCSNKHTVLSSRPRHGHDAAQLVSRKAGVTMPDGFYRLFTTPDLVFVWEELHIGSVDQTAYRRTSVEGNRQRQVLFIDQRRKQPDPLSLISLFTQARLTVFERWQLSHPGETRAATAILLSWPQTRKLVWLMRFLCRSTAYSPRPSDPPSDSAGSRKTRFCCIRK